MSPASSQTNVYMSQTSGFEPFTKKSSASSQQNSSGYASRTESITRNCSSTTGNAMYDGSCNGVYSILKNSNMSLPSANVVASAHSVTGGGGRRGGREEEEEELVNVVTNSPVEMDRQFRPIYKPNDSGNSTPIGAGHGRSNGHKQQHMVNNGNGNGYGGGSRRATHNHSNSSYANNDEYANGGNNANSRNGWANNHFQPYFSSQTIAN
jgi:hypothetical protein